MLKIILTWALAATLCACGGNPSLKTAAENTADMHTAENSLDYTGTYKGTLPAADCPGIETTLTLFDDGCYKLHMNYIDRKTSFVETGKYTLAGNLLMLTDNEDKTSTYSVEENRLRMLGADNEAITGELADHYILTKTN